jgi:lysophospholipase L1-like esterase
MRRALLIAAAVLALPSPAAASVLVVGDSLEEGTGPHLQRELADLGVIVDARRGRPSPEGIDVLRARLRPEHDVVVFDLGTNDAPSQPETLAASLRAARELAGARCLVVASIQRPPLGGVTVDGLDGAVRDFVAETPTAELADWRAASSEPGVLASDGIHATPDGYALRARLVENAVRACFDSGGGVPLGPPPRARRRRQPAVLVDVPILRVPSDAVMAVLTSPFRLFTSAGRRVGDALTPGTPEPVLGAG